MSQYNEISILQTTGNDNNNTFILFRITKNYLENNKLFNYLKNLAELRKTQNCFLYINPIEDSIYMNNRDFFILYHKQSDKIIAWVNVVNEIITSSDTYDKIYTTKIDKIVVIKNFAGLNYIGTFLIKYILDIYTKNTYKYYDSITEEYVERIPDYIYLYSLKKAQQFYDKIDDLIRLDKTMITSEVPENYDLIYYKRPNIIERTMPKKIRKQDVKLNTMHIFDIEEVNINPSEFASTTIDVSCYDLTPPTTENESLIFKYISKIQKKLPIIDMYTYIHTRKIKKSLTTTRSIIKKNKFLNFRKF